MNEELQVLAINPGSTSTKVALFGAGAVLFETTVNHPHEELAQYEHIGEQLPLRKAQVLSAVSSAGYGLDGLHAVVGRGGLTHPVPGGTYLVCDRMLEDLHQGVLGEHASNLGGLIARSIADPLHIPSFIVDPVVVDELEPLARYSGIPELPRTSIFHALNQKAVARRAAEASGRAYEDCRFVVAHLGGGITVAAHRYGRVIDVNDGLNGEGPFSPERSGGLAALKIVKLCFGSGMSQAQISRRIKGNGGLVAYLGTNDGREVAARIAAGDRGAAEVYEAMAYQVAKEIGAMAAVLEGEVDAVLITGGLAHDRKVCDWIENRVAFIAPVQFFPGEYEMTALAEGAYRVLNGSETARSYLDGLEGAL
ncbi:MAG: butyrate kinase [Spirochaetaceae bacterium]|nr:MAG: butyrate kinase [Spirochaetaceae bacterium]